MTSPPRIYFDNNSTTPIDSRVLDAMVEAWRTTGANPSSQHQLGQQARRRLDEVREAIAQRLGATPDDGLILTFQRDGGAGDAERKINVPAGCIHGNGLCDFEVERGEFGEF